MIYWKVREVAQRKGITSAVQLATVLDVAPGTATSLWYGRSTRIDMPILNRVCARLECGVADVLEFDGQEYTEENLSAELVGLAA